MLGVTWYILNEVTHSLMRVTHSVGNILKAFGNSNCTSFLGCVGFRIRAKSLNLHSQLPLSCPENRTGMFGRINPILRRKERSSAHLSGLETVPLQIGSRQIQSQGVVCGSPDVHPLILSRTAKDITVLLFWIEYKPQSRCVNLTSL